MEEDDDLGEVCRARAMDSSEVRGSEFVQRLGEAGEKTSVVESCDLSGASHGSGSFGKRDWR